MALCLLLPQLSTLGNVPVASAIGFNGWKGKRLNAFVGLKKTHGGVLHFVAVTQCDQRLRHDGAHLTGRDLRLYDSLAAERGVG